MSTALKFVQDPSIPWQRVISSAGKISYRGDDGEGARRQRERLEAEGVEVRDTPGDQSGGKVSIGEYGWLPESVEGL